MTVETMVRKRIVDSLIAGGVGAHDAEASYQVFLESFALDLQVHAAELTDEQHEWLFEHVKGGWPAQSLGKNHQLAVKAMSTHLASLGRSSK